MTLWLAAVLAGALLAGLAYARAGGAPAARLLPAALRWLATTLVVALLLDAPIGRARPAPPLVALDASASWLRDADSSRWRTALDSARAGGDSLLLFGDSVRPAGATPAAQDAASRVRPMVERALAAGRPLVVITDGELADPEALSALPGGSRVVVPPAGARPDAAVSALDAPRALVSGDTLLLRATVVGGAAGAGAGEVVALLDGAPLARVALEALPSFGERTLPLRAVARGDGPRILSLVVRSAGDRVAPNDTLAVTLELAPQAGAVMASTAPDQDARFALALLRGTLAFPARGYWRVAPGQWRLDGPLTPVPEAEVRRALAAAPLAVLHGDTALFGAPRQATRGSLALVVPPPPRAAGSDGEWYATGAPTSPLAPFLSGLPWDSLPPVDVGPSTPDAAGWVGVEARRSRRGDARALVYGAPGPRRVAVIPAAGLWRWRFRGGVAGDAFAAVWGSVFEWLADERSDARAAVPADGVLRAGTPIAWRRGTAGDTLVTIALRRRGAPASDTVTLRFARDAGTAESPALAAGVWEATMRGGTATLMVNPSAEWVPRRATVRAGALGRGSLAGASRGSRELGWLFVVAVLALCGEWWLRRRAGYR